jgi:hypothetical protein
MGSLWDDKVSARQTLTVIESQGFSVPPLAQLKWLAVDLDGTLAEPIWTPENPTAEIGAPIRRNVVKLREAVAKGYNVVIHTSRPWTDYQSIEEWSKLHQIPVRRIQCGKLLAAAYIDDRAIHAEESQWLPR